MNSWVLMYHRICERTPATACWFARGTAVTPEALERQLAWVRERFEVVSLPELVLDGGGRGPRVAITFDDGYGETLRLAAPICARLGVRAACFASAAPVLDGEPLWFDALYAAVGAEVPGLGALVASWGLEPPRDLQGWINGPVKRWLSGLGPEALRRCVTALVALAPTARPPDFYLGVEDLAELARQGWVVGGHGRTHARLTGCDDRALGDELDASRSLLECVLGQSGTAHFAYPDGAWDERVAQRVAEAGFHVACTVDRGPVEASTSPLAVPRLFCRGDEPAPHKLLLGGLGRLE